MNSLRDKALEDILAPLANATSNSSIKLLLTKALASIGYENWVIAYDNPSSMFGMSHLMSGIPLQWVATYVAKGYVKIDPIIKHCRESEEALCWDAVDGWDAAPDNVRDFMRNLLASGFGSGLVVPLRSSSGKHGILSIVNSQPLKETRENYLQNLASARAIGVAAHSALERIRT